MSIARVSALIPTRGRVESLRRAIASLPDEVEPVLYVDLDDVATILALPSLPPHLALIGPRYGYERLEECFNHLARLATGDWLLLYGDDCTIEGVGWIGALAALDPAEPWYLCGTNDRSEWPCFPVVSRGAVEAMGCFSRHRACDSWWKEVFARRWPERRRALPMHVTNGCITPVPAMLDDEWDGFCEMVERAVAAGAANREAALTDATISVSVLCPSRGRPGKLAETLQSLEWTISNRDHAEVILRVDSDDVATLQGIADGYLPWTGDLFAVVGPRHQGYRSMATFWNEMARVARGPWLQTFNDDARMVTPDWDRAISAVDPATNLLLAPADDSTDYGWVAFPTISCRIPAALGHLTLFPGVDTWLTELARLTPFPAIRIPVTIRHERPCNPAYAHLDDATWHESDAAEQSLCSEWASGVWLALAQADAFALQEALR